MIETLVEYLRMGGYAFYVWASYAITFLVLALNWWLPQRRRRRIRQALARQARLSRAAGTAGASGDAPAGTEGSDEGLSTPGVSSS